MRARNGFGAAARPPRISIVTISYNKGPFIEECLRSVLEQDCPGVEYIVVDAGSTDGSRETIRRYADRLAAYIEEPDHGPADGLNKGFARARAPLLGYINADDRYTPGALRFVVDYFTRNTGVDVLGGAIRILNEAGVASRRKRTSDRFDLADYAAGICSIAQQATFFRRTAFDAAGGFNAANRVAWDGELMVDMALAGARFATVPKVLGDFRIYGGSITKSAPYREKMQRYHATINEKVARAGGRLYAPQQVPLRRLLYKLDLARHIDYFLVG